MPGCGLGLKPHHIDEQKERSLPSSDRKGTLTLSQLPLALRPGLVTQPRGDQLSLPGQQQFKL
ncbi:hypothetical protein ACRRTK_014357 [Alexandromys fortis]